jgi:hypothetical protein
MKFKTHNEKDINISGTSLVEEIDASYEKLVEKFGDPDEGDAYKVDAMWKIEFEDGKVATIYNYKDGKNYNGDEGLETTKIRDWYIGGYDNTDVVERILLIIKN